MCQNLERVEELHGWSQLANVLEPQTTGKELRGVVAVKWGPRDTRHDILMIYRQVVMSKGTVGLSDRKSGKVVRESVETFKCLG